MAALQFSISNTDVSSKARAGFIQTDHGNIETPIFTKYDDNLSWTSEVFEWLFF